MLVHVTAGPSMFSFMDRFSGYNYIKIQRHEAEKTALTTLMDDFHYIVMPSGLKNVGATNRQAINTSFHDTLYDFLKII